MILPKPLSKATVQQDPHPLSYKQNGIRLAMKNLHTLLRTWRSVYYILVSREHVF